MGKQTGRCEWCGDIAQGKRGCPAEVEIERLRAALTAVAKLDMDGALYPALGHAIALGEAMEEVNLALGLNV